MSYEPGEPGRYRARIQPVGTTPHGLMSDIIHCPYRRVHIPFSCTERSRVDIRSPKDDHSSITVRDTVGHEQGKSRIQLTYKEVLHWHVAGPISSSTTISKASSTHLYSRRSGSNHVQLHHNDRRLRQSRLLRQDLHNRSQHHNQTRRHKRRWKHTDPLRNPFFSSQPRERSRSRLLCQSSNRRLSTWPNMPT